MDSTQETIELTNVAQTIEFVQRWQMNMIQRLQQMLQVPENTPASFNGGPEEPLTGDLRKGFQGGLTVALHELANFPFVEVKREEQQSPN